MAINEIDKQILSTAHDVEEYVNEIKSKPDDYAHAQLLHMQRSIETAEKALDSYVIKDDASKLQFDAYYDKLDSAIKFLVQKGEEENKKAISDKSHAEKANEIVVAINAIKYLVALLRDVQEEKEFNPVDMTSKKNRLGQKVEKSTGSTFNEKK
jgi:hypothetical protein